ncbi:spore wall protein 2 [Drosophila mauritiana]|uniref:Spore wall protein 2 n=1 Tax=Drosophila mauritiana TaxID=7226 RepID=A0A6P8L7L6_DROMA|nr:spore wall protein 2 [Drosophila mauritiana]
MIPWICLSAAIVLILCPLHTSSRSYSNGLIFYELKTHRPYLPPTVSVSRGRNLASVKYSEKGSIWSTFGQPCECNGPTCGCCAGLKVDQYRFDQKVCANVSFVPHLEEAQLEVFLNGRPSSKYGISVRNPAPFCIPVMMGVPMAMCVQMTDVTVVGNNLNMCMDFVVRMATTDLFEMHFQCMRMGLDGLQYVDKNGNPVLPVGDGQSDDPEEYEYAELEDQPEEYPYQEDVKEEAPTQGYQSDNNLQQMNTTLTTGQVEEDEKEENQSMGYQPLITNNQAQKIEPQLNLEELSYQPQKNQTLSEPSKQNQVEKEEGTQNEESGYQTLGQIKVEDQKEEKPAKKQPEIQQPSENTLDEKEPMGYQPPVAMDPHKVPEEQHLSEDLQEEEEKTLESEGDHQEDEELEDVEPLPIESEMLMASDQSEEAPLEEEAEETPAEDAKETAAEAAEKEKETETDSQQETPDNDNGYGESGLRPSQVIETITNSIKATEAPTTTTTATITKIPTTTTKIPTAATTFNKPNIGIDDTNNGEKTVEAEGEKTVEEPEKEGETSEEGEAEDDEEDSTTVAVEMENDSDNEINVDDDDEVEKKNRVKEPPSQVKKGETKQEEAAEEKAEEGVQKEEREPEKEVKASHEEKVNPNDTAAEEDEDKEEEGEDGEDEEEEGEEDEDDEEEEEEDDEKEEGEVDAAEESAEAAKPEESAVKIDENGNGYENAYANANENASGNAYGNANATPAAKSLSRRRRLRTRRLPRPLRKHH